MVPTTFSAEKPEQLGVTIEAEAGFMATSSFDDSNNPGKQMQKSGSQVLGKARQRPHQTREQFLKDLNTKNQKIQYFDKEVDYGC